MTIEEFVQKHKLSMKVWRNRTGMNVINDLPRQFMCRLGSGITGEQFVTPFAQGSAYTEDPTIEDVLDCIGSDISCVIGGETITDFGNEFGYEYEEASRLYWNIRKEWENMQRLVGSNGVQELVYDVERM